MITATRFIPHGDDKTALGRCAALGVQFHAKLSALDLGEGARRRVSQLPMTAAAPAAMISAPEQVNVGAHGD